MKSQAFFEILPVGMVVLGALALAPACSSKSGDGPAALHRWDLATAHDGVLEGRLQDQDTGAAIAGASVSIGQGVSAQRVTTGADGTFKATTAAGRVRVAVESGTHVGLTRDVAVGEAHVQHSLGVVQRGETRKVGSAGDSVAAGEGRVEITAGTFDAADVTSTYFGKNRVAALSGSPQFVDMGGGPTAPNPAYEGNLVPNRILAALDFAASVPFVRQVQLRLPVQAGIPVDAITVYRSDTEGRWVASGVVATVADGHADFAIGASGAWAVGVDARKAESTQAGYLVLDRGDSTSWKSGDALVTGMVGSELRSMVVADPWGSLLTVERGGRVMLQPPAPATPGGTEAPYAGRLAVMAGTVEVVTPRLAGVAEHARISVVTPAGTFTAIAAAFDVSVCESAGKPVVRVEVAEGSVSRVAESGSASAPIEQGHAAVFCAGCGEGAPPVCTPSVADAGASPDVGTGPDAAEDTALPPDAGVPDASPPEVDAAPEVDASAPDVEVATCTDRTQNGDETAVDCGGSCPPCTTWYTNAAAFRGMDGTHQQFHCPAPGAASTVWGTDTYTDDSSVCTAAVHSGLITLAAGGDVTIEIRPGQAAYVASTRGGVTSASYGTWGGSYVFFPLRVPNCGNLMVDGDETDADCGGPSCPACAPGKACKQPSDCDNGMCTSRCVVAANVWANNASAYRGMTGAPIPFVCPPDGTAGSVWGTGTYTDDSSICTAAVHAGKITLVDGGTVYVEIRPGQDAYVGSTQNGITSSSYPAYLGSFGFP
jgi:hypothetical protein